MLFEGYYDDKAFSLVLSPKTKSSGHRFSRMMAAVLALILGLSLMACSNPSATAPSSSEADTTDTSAQVSDTETDPVFPDYVDTIVKVCKEYGIPCLNLHEDFGFNWEQHTIDGCHPNEEGHRLIADAIEAKLNAMLGKS